MRKCPDRQAALDEGRVRYFTGRPCVHGHVCERTTSDRGCIMCSNKKVKLRYWSDPERFRSEARASRVGRVYSIKEREAQREQARLWRKENPGHHNFLTASAKKATKQRTPAWADKDAIRDFYKACPKGYHVDHRIPLRGRNVSGLHVMENLQYLPAVENMKKNNRYEAA